MTNQTHKTKAIFAVFIMVILMIATRGHTNWLSSIIHLPDFTIPALFIAGVYLRTFWVAIVIIASAFAIDNYAIIHEGVSVNCITPAYSVLPLTYYGIFWVGKYLTILKIDHNIIKNTLIIIMACATQWFIATASYFAFTTSPWGKFGSYIVHWSIIEIPLVLYWMVAIFITFTLNHRYLLMPYFSAQKD
ncbi:conserved hypothetical protein [Abyssogena phaseoliformis symbiont OG214]|uniref:hypothetical protein n=1 Tax=Abyssogena phaseoliformis symbiont TaxID=596095 RepID=UPI001915048F|nr:hypothetical protein [Abyssogena phaseoliformis symbiont]MBW5289373.1 Optional hypothetical component of the B12 transporter BtuM [Candidatus Ruthia sp. Apha_13_S6]BBB22606.1 conserved hypothetical protein [Abyssogena phaseoliformis symbiont OG214]